MKTDIELKEVDDIQVNGFNSEYSKWIYDGRWNDIITIPAGGDYFNSIKIILKKWNNNINESITIRNWWRI